MHESDASARSQGETTAPPREAGGPCAAAAPVAACDARGATAHQGYEIHPGHWVDDFEVLAVMARSGMGSVFKARQRGTGKTVVLKVPHLHLESDVAFYDRFVREERIGLRLAHPAIARVLAVPEKSRPYLAMEYIEGESLYRRMTSGDRLPTDRVLAIGQQVCVALAYMHAQRVVHRDLKPENIVLDAQGHVVLVDFGVALDFGARRLTWSGLSCRLGTPEYMAPEQIQGRRGDGRADLYALGIILYELLAGTMPYEAPTLSALMMAKTKRPPRPLAETAPGLDPRVAAVVMRALAIHLPDRYADATEMLDALRDPLSAAVPPSNGMARFRRAAVVARALARWVLIGLVFVGLIWLAVRSR